MVVSTELVFTAVVAVVGLSVALTSVRDAAIAEFSDIASSVQEINQSYAFNTATGHSSTTAGSDYQDASDHCDLLDDTAGQSNGITLTAPEQEDEGVTPIDVFVEAEGSDTTASVGISVGDGWLLWSNGTISFDVEVFDDGLYTLESRLWGSQGGPDLPNAAFTVGGVPFADFDVSATSHATAETFSADTNLMAGIHTFAVEFTNDFFVPPIDRNLFIDWMTVFGPN